MTKCFLDIWTPLKQGRGVYINILLCIVYVYKSLYKCVPDNKVKKTAKKQVRLVEELKKCIDQALEQIEAENKPESTKER